MTRRPVKVTLVEAPAVSLTLDGAPILDDFTLRHPKYSQLILAANLQRLEDPPVAVRIVDLKGGGDVEAVPYGEFDYCGARMEMQRVGVPFEAAREHFAADVIGICANFTFERSMVVQTIDAIGHQQRRPLIVVGGHDATADPLYYLERGADLCVLGEGETAMQEIVRAVAENAAPTIPGTASLCGGVLRRDARRRPHQYEDIAFPDVGLVAASNFTESPDGPLPGDITPRLMSLETSRGCPEACTFCDVSFIVGRYRPAPMDRVMRQVDILKTAGIRTLQVLDDNLLYRTLPGYEGSHGRNALIDLFTRLYDEGFAWEFFNGFQLGLFERDGVVDEALIAALFRNGYNGERFVGCFRSYLPFDKVTPGEMARLRKLKPLEVTEAVVRTIAAQRVPALALGFVIGSVRETVATLEETISRADQLRAAVLDSSGGQTMAIVLPLCSVPLPGTPDFRSFAPQIAFPAEQYPELYNIFVSVVRSDAFTPIELMRHRQRFRDVFKPDAHDQAGQHGRPR